MYVRSYPPGNQAIKLPENYSGNAFNRNSPYSDMPPPLRTQVSRQQSPPPSPPPQSDIPADEFRPELIDSQYIQDTEEKSHEPLPVHPESAAPSIFSSLLPKGNLSSHFPFGHGIGSEELLILAVMLMVFLSGNESGDLDSEFILLLGLLLFAG